MKILLDTHAFIWWRNGQKTLGVEARKAIARADAVYVSLASAWEATIKASLGRIRLAESFRDGIQASGFSPLAVEFSHIERIIGLPHHHRDPFDRLIVAQALVEGLVLMTEDPKLAAYGVPIMEAL